VLLIFAVALTAFHPYTEAMGKREPAKIEYRTRFEAELNAIPGKHLVIVRYGPNHVVVEEWVYNRADIDGARVVWAREIPGMEMGGLLEYYRDRKVWLAEADTAPPRLEPYLQGQGPQP